MRKTPAFALVIALLLAATYAAGPGDARAESHAHGLHHSYADMHTTVSHSDLSDEDKERLHRALGDAADMESAQRQADLLQRQLALQSDPQKKQELRDQIDALHADFDRAQAAGKDELNFNMSQYTQVGDTISNLISQANTMINDSVWKETH